MGSKARFVRVLLLEILLVGVVSSDKNQIDLTNGAYTNLLIAIDKDVPEDLTIIDNLKTMFISASNRLYLASKQHVYWKHIKILVPNTWSFQSQYEFARTETFETANIIVRDYQDNEPIVDQIGGCGEQGIHMHLSPKYILNETYREDKFGRTDIVLVRNWGYLRWGLFKEHYDGTGVGDPAYDTVNGLEGTRCSLKIKGRVLMPDGSTCRSHPNDGVDGSCRFVADSHGQSATASILFGASDAHVHSIEEFCGDNSTDPDSLHNAKAPNKMNNMCGGKSAWTVMKEKTTDFQAGIQPVSDTTPIFEVIQMSSVRSVVLVLDISGSMQGSRFDNMIAATSNYILQDIPIHSQLGIVAFSGSSATRASLTAITDEATRQYLVSTLPPSAGGGTCIGCGIMNGLQVLGSYAKGGYLFLLSDGIESSTHPQIRDTYDDIDNSGVIVDTITISSAADPQMEDLSTRSSGMSKFCSDNGNVTCLIQAMQDTITERPDVGMVSVPTQIYSSEVVVESNPRFKTIPVIIDGALGNDTVITVIWTMGSTISVVLTGPDGTRVDENDPRYHIDYGTKIVSINLPVAKPGLWNITMYTQITTEYASVVVTSKPSTDGYKPVTVSVILGSREVDFSQTPALAIYAQVQQDYQPVLNADITAIISDSYSGTTTMPLLDNGSGSDLFKGDGTYSGFFLSFTSNGRYNVKVNVQGYDDAIEVAEVRRRKRSAVPEVQDSASQPSFMRTASGGVFKVESFTPNAPDTLAPSRIQDLVYTSFNYDNSTVTLSWTAVGDDMDQGTAYSYELRYSTNFSEVRNNFNNSHRVTQDQLVYGNISDISSAGVVESVTISLPERGQDIVYYFAIRAWDETGNGGDLSNIASLSIRFIPLAVNTTMDPTTIVTDVETDLISTIIDQTQAFTDLTSGAALNSTTESVSATPSKTATPISTTDDPSTTVGQSNIPLLTTYDAFTTGGQTSTASPVTTTGRAFTTDSLSRTPVSTTEHVLTRVADPESTTNEVSSPLLTGSQKSSSSKPMMSSANIKPTIGNSEMTTNPDASRTLNITEEPRTTSSSDELTTRTGHTTESVSSKEPSEPERTTNRPTPEPTEPTESDNHGLVIGLSCAVGVVTVIAVVFMVYSFFLKQSITNVKRISPTPSSGAEHQELTVVEVDPQDPTFNNPTHSTA